MQLGYNIKKSLFLYNSTSQVKSVFANKDFFLSRINIYIYIYIFQFQKKAFGSHRLLTVIIKINQVYYLHVVEKAYQKC